MSELIDFLQNEDVKQFIEENIGSDVAELVLNAPAHYKENIKGIAAQVLARQKAKGKLDSWATNLDLVMPPPLSIEQASSSATCAYKAKLISGGLLVDLTGGMGIDFLSLCTSFDQATYVERDLWLCNVFQHNAKVLKNRSRIVNEEANSFLRRLETQPQETVIYLDPARRDDQKKKVFKIEDCSPNLLELIPLLKSKADKALIKFSPMLDIGAILNSISNICEIHVVSVKNECKELLLVIDFAFEGSPQIHCLNLDSEHVKYSFQADEERTSEVEISQAKRFLFEPNSSVLKAGAFKKVSADFKVDKLSENTHLYTSDVVIDNFPGKIFKVISNAQKSTLKEFAPGGRINVVTRNHHLSANELKKKWKLKDGGDYYLIGFRDMNGKSKTIIAELVDPLKQS